MITEVVSLSAYESQVSAVTEAERMAMEFFISCAPENRPVTPGAGAFQARTVIRACINRAFIGLEGVVADVESLRSTPPGLDAGLPF